MPQTKKQTIEYPEGFIKTLKINLLLALIRKPTKELTNSEANIAYELSKDGDIQDLLKE